jgi:hypothetical protein
MPKSQIITQKIIEIRGHKVLLDFDLLVIPNNRQNGIQTSDFRQSKRMAFANF